MNIYLRALLYAVAWTLGLALLVLIVHMASGFLAVVLGIHRAIAIGILIAGIILYVFILGVLHIREQL